MLGDEVKVTSWRDGDAEDQQATLHLRNSTKSKPILLNTPVEQRLKEYGTRVSVRLKSGRATLLVKIPESGSVNLFAPENRTQEMTLAQTVSALAPALDIDVWSQDGGGSKLKLIEANDWKTITPLKLLQRLAPVYSEKIWNTVQSIFRILPRMRKLWAVQAWQVQTLEVLDLI